MIIAFFLNNLDTQVNALKASLPAWTHSETVGGWVAAVGNYLHAYDNFIPIHDGLLPILALFALVYSIFATISLGIKAANVIRGVFNK